MDLDDAAVRELVDARAIEHLMVRYFDAVDALDPFAAVEIFTDDIEGDFMTGKVYRGPRAIARALGKILLQYEHTSHHITNHRATITGDTATALTYIYAFHRMRASEDTWHLWARHVDQLVRTADGCARAPPRAVRRRLGAAVVEDRRLVVLRASRPSRPRRARATARRVERPTVTGERRRAAEVFDLGGRVVWVTGSSRGIGAGIARHLADHGATVVVHGRKPGSTDAVLADLRGATAVVGDVRDPEAVSAAVDVIAARHGRLDGVVANVGGAAPGRLDDTDPARFSRQLDLNLVSAFSTLRAAHPLLETAGGAAVLVSATAAGSATPDFAAYGAAKAGVEHLARTMAAEWGPRVRVNAVCPGLIRTEGSLAAVFAGSEELVARAGRTTAVGRIGEPEDVAWACHFLLSPAAAFVSGATLVVDGGQVDGPTQRILRAIAEPDDGPVS